MDEKSGDLKISYTAQDAKKVLWALITFEFILVVIYLIIHIDGAKASWGPFRTLFDLDGDLSIPSWFSSVQLFLTGCVLFIVSRNNHRKHHLPSSFLVAGCLVFIYLSADEGASIHEKITRVAIKLDMNWMIFGGNHGAWVTIYILMILLIALLGYRYFRNLLLHFRRETQIAFCGFVTFAAGAVGLEIINYLFLNPKSMSVLYKVEVAIEELLEMIGISIVLYATLLMSITISSAPSE